MRKVVMVAPLPPPNGGITNWVQLMVRYAKNKKDTEFLHINTAPKSRGVDGRTIWDRIVISGLDMLRKNSELRKVLSKDAPEVVHMTTSGQLALLRDNLLLKTAVRKHIPTVYHIHFGRTKDIAAHNTTEWKLLKAAVLKAAVTIAIDLDTYETLRSCCPKAQIVYIPNPVDSSGLPEPGEYSETLAYLGWIVPTKGIQELLTVWEYISRKYPNWQLKLVGPYKLEYRQMLEKRYCMDRVVWTGELPHDQAMTAICDCGIFTLPSYTEGFPNAVVEAMALGRPIVATAVGAIPDMLANGCGSVVPAKEISALQNELETMLASEDLRKQMGKRARVKAVETYDIGIVFEQYVKLWDSAAACGIKKSRLS